MFTGSLFTIGQTGSNQVSTHSRMDEESMAYSHEEYYTAVKTNRPQRHPGDLTNIMVNKLDIKNIFCVMQFI